MLPEKIIFVGVAVNLITSIWYVKNILYGSTRPNLISWFLWMLAPFIGIFFELKAGAGLSVLPVFMAGFGPLLVILFSIWNKNTYWKITKFDTVCGIFSFLALILYIFTHNLGISILFAIISDGLASIPTLIKSWKFPETETGSIYLGSIFSNTLGLLIIKNWIFSIYSFGIYLLIVNLSILFCIYHKKISRKFKPKICS
jgi:hypothetical protein